MLALYIEAESSNPDEQDLKLVISTRRLFSLMEKNPLTQTDATYKLLWQGYLVLIVGTRKDFQVPLEAKNIRLGQKRKRGKPAMVKQALLLQ